MPLTFIEIEKQKSWRIGVLLLALICLYFLAAIFLLLGLSVIFPFLFLYSVTNPLNLAAIFAFSLIAGGMHFWFAASGAVQRVIRQLDAAPPDPEDSLHMQLINITKELHIATGNTRKMSCMVIPSLSMNALAVDDLNGEAVIAVTEGLLSKLSRAQMEAVMAHEAYHILSGDCMETTVAASFFGMYASALEKLRNIDEEKYRGYHPAFLLFWVLVRLSQMLNMLISREREYRADAASIRMTRNPLAMAEVLYILSRGWTGVGLISSGIEMLCIVNPEPGELDESEGWWSNLMATHPPISKRIKTLLMMAHMNMSALKVRPEVNTGTGDMSPTGEVSSFACPSCKESLFVMSYEKTTVHQCYSCGGIMVENNKIPRILARREVPCTDRIRSLAKAVLTDNQRNLTVRRLRSASIKLSHPLKCPKCRNTMFRKFYSLAYLLEIDRCNVCGITWFDKDELEMLQCLIENKITASIALPGLEEEA